MQSDHMGLTISLMLWGVFPEVACTLRSPSQPRSPRGDADPSALNSAASRQAAGRAGAWQCRAATRHRAGSRECKASLPAGVHRGPVARATARQVRPRAGRFRPRGCGRCGAGQDEDKAQTACLATARAPQESKAPIPGRNAYGSAPLPRRARRCERRDHPMPTAGNADRLLFAPKRPVARPSARSRRSTAARRPAARRSPVCRDRLRKVRPQRDHLRARGCCGRSTMVRAERRMTVWAAAELRRAASPADVQIARKSGLRRTHSQANPRAFNFSSAR